jgi:dihydroneopterin aldolase
MDTITIKDLEVRYCVGVPEAEREQPQRLLLTLELRHDFANAVARDDLRRTIDYLTVCQRLLAYGTGRSWRLIEKLAVDVADLIRREFGATSVRVEVKKFIIPEAAYVSVTVERPAP